MNVRMQMSTTACLIAFPQRGSNIPPANQRASSHSGVITMLRRCLSAVLAFGVVIALSGELFGASPKMRAHFINVGQAASALLEFPCGAVLIDAGAQDKDFAQHLAD